MAFRRIDDILKEHKTSVKEKGIYLPPEYKNCPSLETLSDVELERMTKEIKQDLRAVKGRIIKKGKTLVIWRYPEEMAASRPYYSVLRVDREDIPLIIKDRDANVHKLPSLHPTNEPVGTSLLRIIDAPTYSVIRGERYDYLQFIGGPRLADIDLELIHPDDLNDVFYDLGRACAEAHVIGMIDRRRNTLVSTAAINGSTFSDLIQTGARGIVHIDTASSLYQPALSRKPENDTEMIIELLGFYKDLINFSQNDYLTKLFEGFRERYKAMQSYFVENKLAVVAQIHSVAGDMARPILNRLDVNTTNIDSMVKILEQKIRHAIIYKRH
ncbi:hypothetical protein J4206_00240 [Candidatus Woesearchaeota archaeon]|nr:hypothetical protein [Candidatus Woesearchaeota archaeon]